MIRLFTTFIKGISWLVAHSPRWLQVGVGSTLGLIWFYIVPIRRKVVLENIEKAFPHWDKRKRFAVARKNFMNYGCGFVELLLLPQYDERVFKKLIEVEGMHNVQKAVEDGHGMFFLSLHMGSWELMSASNSHLKMSMHVITKKMKGKGLNQIWVDLRLGRGIRMIEAEKTSFQILRAIRANEGVGYILDQFMGPPVGVRTKFFGHETGTAASLALFADRTRAPVIPTYNVRLPNGRIRIVFEEPVPFVEQGSTEQNISFMTQIYTSKIEEIVKKHPEQWLWLHRRWKPFRE
jgi:KDO2-lipid IV(A) lauroyltransferase